MISSVNQLDEFIEEVSAKARSIVDGSGSPYDVGIQLWSQGMTGNRDNDLRDVAWPLWLIWGSLTDWIDGPKGEEPGAVDDASAAMKRAAEEWLVVAQDRNARDQYFDRWVYEECGYERPH
jgi:hypothetical protein